MTNASENTDGEELVAVPRNILGAACAAIRKKLHAPNTLAQINRYAVHGPALAKPASSPAGARVEDVARTLYASTHPVVRAHYGYGGSFCDFSELEQVERDRLNAMAEAAIAALSPSTSAAEPVAPMHGPYRVKWLGAGVWAGINEELPAELEGKDVWLTTAPPAPAAVDGQRVKAPLDAEDEMDPAGRIRACLATDKEGA